MRVLADVEPDHATEGLRLADVRHADLDPRIVEPHAIDERTVLRKTEQARLGIARLRARRKRADLDEGKAKTQQLARDLSVLIKAGGKTERMGELETEDLHGQARIDRRRPPNGRDLEAFNRRAMGGLGRKPGENRPRRGGKRAGNHASSDPNSWAPWAPKGSGRRQRTKVIGSGP